MHDALGDRVPTWTTLNEPWCSSLLGYGAGHHAPGRAEPRAAVAASTTCCWPTGWPPQALRSAGVGSGRGDELGITLNLSLFSAPEPVRPQDEDLLRRLDGLQNRVFLDPVLTGDTPPTSARTSRPFGLDDHVQDGDLRIIGTPIDVLGVNYYTPPRCGTASASTRRPGSAPTRRTPPGSRRSTAAPRAPRWAGTSPPTACATCWCAWTATTTGSATAPRWSSPRTAPPTTTPSRSTAGSPTRTVGRTWRRTCARATRRSRRASRSPATWPGR